MRLKKSKFCFITIGLITLALGVLASYFLPEKYLYDAVHIYNDPYNEKGFIRSYPVSMWFYDFFMLNKLPFSLIGAIQITTIFWLFFKQGIPEKFNRLYFSNILIWFSLIAISIYISIPSKEFINILFVFMVVYYLRKNFKNLKIKIIFVLLLFVAYGVWFRPYYALIPFLAIASFFVSKIKSRNKIINIIIVSLLIAVFMSLSYGAIKGEFMSESTREALNEKREGSLDAQTLILSPVETSSILGESVGILYGYFSVNLPFEGLKFIYKPHVILFVFWQLSVFLVLLSNYSKCLKGKTGNFKTKAWIFHILFSYFVIQGVFEPDLGSSIRHKIGILPLIYEAIFYNRIKT